MTSKQVTLPPWNSRKLVHSKAMVWAWRWSVALRTFYRQILSLLYSSFFFWNFRPRLARELLVYHNIISTSYMPYTGMRQGKLQLVTHLKPVHSGRFSHRFPISSTTLHIKQSGEVLAQFAAKIDVKCQPQTNQLTIWFSTTALHLMDKILHQLGRSKIHCFLGNTCHLWTGAGRCLSEKKSIYSPSSFRDSGT